MKYTLTIATIVVLALMTTSVVCAQDADTEWNSLTLEVNELFRTGQYERAIVLAIRAFKAAKTNLGSDHPAVATSLNNLATIYADQSQYAQAEPLFTRALAIREQALGPDHPTVATSLENLAALYRATNHSDETEPLEERAARIRAIKR